MKKYILALSFLYPFIAMSQTTAEQEKILTSHLWRIGSMEIKDQNDDKFTATPEKELVDCPYTATYHFKPGGILSVQPGSFDCGAGELTGKWKFGKNYTEFSMKLDSIDAPFIFGLVSITSSKITLQESTGDGDKNTFIRTILVPAARRGIYMTELYAMTALTADNHATRITAMGFTPAGHNTKGKIYLYKKGHEGELSLHYDEDGRFKRISYYTFTRLSQEYVREFGNDNTFYIVESKETKYTGSERYYLTKKYYKDGFIFEANEFSQSFRAYKPGEDDIKNLVSKYPHKKFPELQSKPAQEKPAIQPADRSADFCKELAVILTAMENNELGKVVDYNKPTGYTRSWFEAKVPLSGFTRMRGQNMLGYLSFNARLAESNTNDNEILYRQLVKQIESCTGSSFSKKTEESSTKFINKKNNGFVLLVEYYGGKGNYINISIQKSSS